MATDAWMTVEETTLNHPGLEPMPMVTLWCPQMVAPHVERWVWPHGGNRVDCARFVLERHRRECGCDATTELEQRYAANPRPAAE